MIAFQLLPTKYYFLIFRHRTSLFFFINLLFVFWLFTFIFFYLFTFLWDYYIFSFSLDALLYRLLVVRGRKIKIVCEPCFVDYQSTAIGILRNRGSREDNNCQCPASFTLACVINFFLFFTCISTYVLRYSCLGLSCSVWFKEDSCSSKTSPSPYFLL